MARPDDLKVQAATSQKLTPTPQSRKALDWFVFFVADIQTGFGPFVAVYLTSEKWTQTDIGLVLTVAGLVGLAAQVPCGALVDAVRSLRAAAAVAVATIGGAAFVLAAFPVFPTVLGSRLAHAAASCILGPAIASMSLNLVGRSDISARLGRNASFASIGTGLAAAGMGACGYYLSTQAVFFVASILVVPALVTLFFVRKEEVAPVRVTARSHAGGSLGTAIAGLRALASSRALLTFAACTVLFQLANAAMLPLAASMMTLRSSSSASATVAAAIVVPQLIVAVLSPLVGRRAETWGRRPLLLIGFAALPIRGFLFAVVSDPQLLVLVQMLDGVSAAVLGVLVPLTIADVTRRSGHFNLAQGAVGSAVGVGASISATVAGNLADHYGSYSAFLAMTSVAMIAWVVVLVFMPETRLAGTDEKP